MKKRKKCLICDNSVKWNGTKPKFCSKKCYGISKIGKNNSNFVRGWFISQDGYKKILKPLNKRKHKKDFYIQEHRQIVEDFLRRPLKIGEIVHHINGNKLDNRIENLVVTTQSNHAYIHGKINSPPRRKDSKTGKILFFKKSS